MIDGFRQENMQCHLQGKVVENSVKCWHSARLRGPMQGRLTFTLSDSGNTKIDQNLVVVETHKTVNNFQRHDVQVIQHRFQHLQRDAG